MACVEFRFLIRESIAMANFKCLEFRVCMAIVMVVGSSNMALAAVWNINNPVEDEDFDPHATIGVEGSGLVSTTYTAKALYGGQTLDSESGTTTTEGDFTEDLDPPTNGWNPNVGTVRNFTIWVYSGGNPKQHVDVKSSNPD